MARNVPPLERVTLSNGVPIGIPKLSALIRQDIAAAVQKEMAAEKPPVPTMTGDYYGNGEQTIENPADPAYQRALARWEAKVNRAAADRVIAYVLRRLEVDVDLEEVERTRADMAAVGVDISEMSDRDVYVRYVAIGPTEDYTAVIQAAFDSSRPTEEAIRAAVESFRAHTAR